MCSPPHPTEAPEVRRSGWSRFRRLGGGAGIKVKEVGRGSVIQCHRKGVGFYLECNRAPLEGSEQEGEKF